MRPPIQNNPKAEISVPTPQPSMTPVIMDPRRSGGRFNRLLITSGDAIIAVNMIKTC